MKSGGFHTDSTHEIRRISKGQLPGMVSPMFPFFFNVSEGHEIRPHFAPTLLANITKIKKIIIPPSLLKPSNMTAELHQTVEMLITKSIALFSL